MAKLSRDKLGRFMSKRSRRSRILRTRQRNPRRRRRGNPRASGFLGLPWWVWLLGGAAVVVYLATRKSKTLMSFPESIIEQAPTDGPALPPAATPADPTGAGYYGYGRAPGGRPADPYGLYRRF